MKSTKRKFFVEIILLSIFFVLAILALTKANDYVVYAATSTDVIEEDSSAENEKDYRVRLIDSQVEAQYSFVKLNDTECSVRLSNKTEATKAIIPSTVIIEGKRYTVTEIYSNGFASAKKLERVRLPATVKKIGNSAFYNCPELETVSLGNTMEIGNSAFSKCPKLININIPESVTKMGNTVFKNNTTKVYINAKEISTEWSLTWNNYNSEGYELDKKFVAKKEYEVLTNPFSRASNSYLGAIVAGGQPVEGEYAEYKVNSEEIAGSCFKVPAQIEYEGDTIDIIAIAEDAFSDIDVDVLVEFSSNPILISSCAFEDYQGKTVYFNRDIAFENYMDNYITEAIFRGSAVQTVVLPNTLNRLPDYIFESCESLENIYFCEISENMTDYEEEVVELKASFNSVIQNKIKEEANKEETDKDNLWGELVNTNGVVVLGGEFNNITEIGSSAFYGTTSINALHLFDDITKIGLEAVFDWNDNQIVRVHNNAKIIFGIDNWDEAWCASNNLLYQNRFYSITFNPNGGELPEDFVITVKNGKPDKNLPEPVYPHYDLVEWLDSEGKNWYDKSSNNKFVNNKLWNEEYDKIVSIPDIKLIAKWDDHIYTVTLDKKGGAGGSDYIKIKYDERYYVYDSENEVMLTAPVRDNYTFNGYNMGDGSPIYNAQMIPINGVKFNSSEDITLYAQWSVKSNPVSLVKGNGSGDVDNIAAVLGEEMPLEDTNGNKLKVPEKEGYQFLGYFCDGDNEPYYKADKNEEYLITERTYASNISVLTAKWKAKSYDIILDADGGVGGSKKVTVTYDEICSAASESGQKYSAPTKRGCKFLGYFATNDDNPYYNADGKYLIGIRPYNNVKVKELTAKWEIINYTLNYGEFEDKIDIKYKKYTVEKDFDFPLFRNDDGRKISWEVSNTSKLNLDEADSENKIIVKGSYVETKAQIIYLNCGKNNPSNKTYLNFGESCTLYDPTTVGYAFVGWYQDNVRVTKITYDKVTNDEIDKIYVTAKWTTRINSEVYTLDYSIRNFSTSGFERIVLQLPGYFSSSCTIVIPATTKQVHIFAKSYSNYNLNIVINSRTTDLDLYLENFAMCAPATSISGNTIYAANTITMSTTNNSALNLYCYNSVTIAGFSQGNVGNYEYNGRYAISCSKLKICHADDLSLRGGKGSTSSYSQKAVSTTDITYLCDKSKVYIYNNGK